MAFSKILIRRDSSSNWVYAEPVLDLGEPGYEMDTGLLKIGNGIDNWSNLPYLSVGTHNNDSHSEQYILATDVTFENLDANGDVGSTAGTVCAGNDPRLFDARTPTAHNNVYHTETYITAAGVTFENLYANGDVGSGANQVSQGDHNHDSAYEPIGEVSTHETTYDHTQLHEHSNKAELDLIVDAGSGYIITTEERNILHNIASGGELNQNAFSIFSDGTNTAEADSPTDIFKFRSANNLLDIMITNDDAIHGDNALFTIQEGNIDHGNLSGLSDDDHEQYILVDGTRAFTGPVGGITPSSGSHLATKDYVDSLLQGLDWQESVISRDLASPPTSPSTGDRYLIKTGATGDWSGHDGEITEWDGSSWIFIPPDEGFCTWVEDENIQVTYNGSSWITFGSTTNHSALSGLQGGTTGEYYHLTAAQYTDLTDGQDSTSHYHASDRNLANATGILAISNGGTNNTSYTTSKFLVFDGSKLASSVYDSSSFAAADHDHDTEYLGITAQAADSDKLDGQEGTYYLNWNNFTNLPSTFTPSSHGNESHTETYITATGVTFENLSANGDVGTGSNQVAVGNHTHTGMSFKYSTSIGDGISTSITVTHNLGTRDVVTQIYKNASPYEEIICDVEHTDLNNTTFSFAEPPATDEFRVVIIG